MSSHTLDLITRYDHEEKDILARRRAMIQRDIDNGTIGLHEIALIPLKYLDVTKLPGVPVVNVMTESVAYKPFTYDFGFKAFERQNQIHWLPNSVPLNEDIRDWKTKLNDVERNLMTHMFPLFVQNDVLVNNVYIHQYAKIFKNNQLQLAFSAIANAESVHQAAYAHLLDELDLPESHYSAFLEYTEMADKYNFTAGFRMDTLLGIAVAMRIFGGLTEGLQLFASFATMFNFSRFNKLKGMGQIVSWSVKDESLHVAFVAQLDKYFMQEFGHLIDMDILKPTVEDACRQIVKNEHRFADLAFAMGPVEGMTAEELKQHVCYIADFRLQQFGMDPIYNVEDPFKAWINAMNGGIEHANFFEQRSTAYSRGGTKGNWDDAFKRANLISLTPTEPV